MPDADLAPHYERLGLAPGVGVADIERAFVKKNFALVQGGGAATTAERAALRAAHDALIAHLETEAGRTRAASGATAPPSSAPAGLIAPPKLAPRDQHEDEFAPFAFDNWTVNAFGPPLLLAAVLLVHQTPLVGLLRGFHVWMHEFGHSTAAWMTGRRATPLPFGWTPIEPDYSPFVYFGLLFLFGVLFAAGLKERKIWPMLAAVALAGAQYFLTWRLSLEQQQFWWTFCGVGGEFYLSALLMAAFFVQLPEKFRWGACRYIFFLIGATAFLNIYLLWRKVHTGEEEIPFGSLINGEDDGGGDMNNLLDGYGWSKFRIRRTYWLLGNGCLAALGAIWLAFVLRLNRVADRLFARLRPEADETAAES